ncbi:MAG TPA: nucleotidyl transferase AbiEii/AbiGii toxin family protein [Candidatus Diapherotrites archaeon]|nr:nucleotidyl transferase AbiEii/AbiGii toxin family protein [Candidatus Diapherotrites archaeon]
MKINLYNRLKKQLHRNIASCQDELVKIIYTIFPEAVFHGGTAIWRCYGGNRFSEDIDLYYYDKKDLVKNLKEGLQAKNLDLIKFKKTDNVVFAKITDKNVEVRLEIRLLERNNQIFKNKTIKQYQNIDGSSMTVFCLSPEELLLEKALAYKNRMLIRDVYDVYYLTSLVNLSAEQKRKFKETIDSWDTPEDEKNLKAIVYLGAIPSFSQLLSEIKRKL